MARKVSDEADPAAVRRVLESGNPGYVGGRAAPELEAAVRAPGVAPAILRAGRRPGTVPAPRERAP